MYEVANAIIAAVVVGLAAVFAIAVIAGAGAESTMAIALCAAYAYSPALGAGVHSLTAPIRHRLDR